MLIVAPRPGSDPARVLLILAAMQLRPLGALIVWLRRPAAIVAGAPPCAADPGDVAPIQRPACAGVCVPVTAIGSMQLPPLALILATMTRPGYDPAPAVALAAMQLHPLGAVSCLLSLGVL